MKIYEDDKLNIIAPAVYLLELDTKETHNIIIPRDASMTDITDHPSFWFLKQVLEFRLINPYQSRGDPLYDEKHGEYALVAAKVFSLTLLCTLCYKLYAPGEGAKRKQ
jgi:hypothetical protein